MDKFIRATGFQEIVIKVENIATSQENNTTEFNFSKNFEPELFQILNEHGNMVLKYQGILSYRIIHVQKFN